MNELKQAIENGEIQISWVSSSLNKTKRYFSYTATGIGVISNTNSVSESIQDAVDMLEFKYQNLEHLYGREKELVILAYEVYKADTENALELLGLTEKAQLAGEFRD